jgi:hypothetical protein
MDGKILIGILDCCIVAKTESVIVGKKYTVAQYFEIQAKKFPAVYGKFLLKGKLRYPALPTINVGTTSKPVLIPPELITVPGGQSRSGVRIQRHM